MLFKALFTLPDNINMDEKQIKSVYTNMRLGTYIQTLSIKLYNSGKMIT